MKLNGGWIIPPLVALTLVACSTEPRYGTAYGPYVSKSKAEENLKQSIEGIAYTGTPSIDGGHAVVLSVTLPDYPEAAQKAHLHGTVTVAFIVETNGVVERIQILRSAGDTLDQLCIDAVKKWRFKPMTHEGQPTTVQFAMSFPFAPDQYMLQESIPFRGRQLTH